MAYVSGSNEKARIVAVSNERTLSGEQLEYFWYAGDPGRFEGIIVIRTDRFGQRWQLQVSRGSYVTLRVAAGLLGVTAMTVSNWLRAGRIHSVRSKGGAVVISLNEVEKMARERGIKVPWLAQLHEEGGHYAP